MLTGAVARPARNLHDHAADPRGLVDELYDIAETPAQSPL
jgi:hypothetical protein